MNILLYKSVLLSLVITVVGGAHASPLLEFKQAITRYIKQTDAQCFQSSQRHADENVSYKKELRYLFKNYGSISPSALLFRLRSAHHEMVNYESDTDGESYKRYEQISSALLLICAQSFFYDARNQLLNALDEIDHLIMYWRYQYHHQVRYFFSKSPTKWIMGKPQAQEIVNNINRLERKQHELYTLLGVLAGHAHALATCDVAYDDCYVWMEELLAILPYNQDESHYNSDGTRLDLIAAHLEFKIKKIDSLTNDLLRSLRSVRQSSHFVQHWIAYAAMLAAAGYLAHYYAHNYDVVNVNVSDKLFSLGRSWRELVIDPSKDIWNTLSGKSDELILQDSKEFEKGVVDFAQDLKDLETKKDFNKKTSNYLKDYLEKDRKNTQLKMKTLLDKWLEAKTIDEQTYKNIIDAEIAGDVTPFQNLFYNMRKTLTDFYWTDDIVDAIVVLAELKIYHYGSSLIQIVFELIIDYGIPVVKEALIVLAKSNKEWAAVYKKVNLILNVAVLTPTIIVGGAVGAGLFKTYKWATAQDYSPIRIALADVNSLLIESTVQLDDHAYGKLLYLVFKLRHRTDSLKDPLAQEFLTDVAKLESKQYSPEIKHNIVENMFNKYAFLGRVAV